MIRLKQIIQLVLLFIATGTYAQQPFFEDFEQAPLAPTNGIWQTAPSRTWAVFETGQGVANIRWGTNPQGNSSLSAYKGTKAAYIYSEVVSSGKAIDWLVTPAINLAQYPTPKLEFYSKTGQVNNQGSIYKVYISSTSQTGVSNFQLLKQWTELEINPNQQIYQKVKLDIPAQYASSTVYLAFVFETNNGDRWFIDDVYVGHDCRNPTQLSVSDITTSSAKISWDNTANNSAWELVITEVNDISFANPVTVTSPFLTATTTSNGNPLEPGKAYRYHIRSKCGNTDQEWSNVQQFTLANLGQTCEKPIQVPTGLPYISTLKKFLGSGGYASNSGTSCGNNSAGYLNGKYTIYKYTPTTNLNIDINTLSQQKKTAVFVYNSCENIGVNCVASAVNDQVTEKNIPNFAVTAGATYYIVVATKSTDPNDTFAVTIGETCTASTKFQSTFFVTGCSGTLSYTLNANITNMGNVGSLTATVFNETNNSSRNINSTGSVTLGSYTNKSQILLQNPQNPNCFLLSPEFSINSCPPINDECQNATALTTFSDGSCGSNPGRLSNATISPQPNSCQSTSKDVWYTFTATGTERSINLYNIQGGNLVHSLYRGNNCNTMTQLYCSESNYSIASDLIIGETYKIRVFSKSALDGDVTFDICTMVTPTLCTTNNAQSINVLYLFKNLLNALIKKQSVNGPFTCPELTQLTPFITDSNPQIYNFTDSSLGSFLSFSFSNHGTNQLDSDVVLPAPSTGVFIKNIDLITYTSPSQQSSLRVIYENGEVQVVRNHVKHINFCPAPCDPISGKIIINPGVSCVATGIATPFVLQTNAGNIANYAWIIYNDKMNPVASYYTANPNITIIGSGIYMARLIVTEITGCTTKFEKYFKVSKTCPSAGDENGNGIPDNTEPGNGSDSSNPGSGVVNNCALYNPQSEIVKDIYINLINHLFALVTSGQPIPPVYSSPQVAALAPYINGGQSVIYNISYENGILKFSFNSSGVYDVMVKNNGILNDFYLGGFTMSGANYKTTYSNGNAYDMHFIRNVNFCAAENNCGPFTGSISFSPGVNVITPYYPTQFSLNTTVSNITHYHWTFIDSNNNLLFESFASNPVVTLPGGSAPHKVKLDITYGNCKTTVTSLAFAPGVDPSSYCSETNIKTPEIKKQLTKLINSLYAIYSKGGFISGPYTSDETNALAPYNLYNSASVYDITWDGTMLRFSFYPGQAPDVQIEMYGPLADLSVLITYNDPTNYITAFALSGFRVTYPQIKSLIFCPQDGSSCGSIYGEIKLNSGASCVTVNTSTGFLFSEQGYEGAQHMWTFYNQSGTSVIGTSSEPLLYITYATPGNYLIKLEIDANSCKSTFYKTVTVSENCGNDTGNGNGTGSYCTEKNNDTALVKQLFQTFLNSLFNLHGQIPNGYTNIELSALSPYITTPNPGVYNISFNNNALLFSFSPNASQPDVVIGNYGTIVDLNILNYSGTGTPSYIATYKDGRQYTNVKANNIIFCPEQPCESHVAFVLDESASISDEEAQKIRVQLRAFVEQQLNSNMTVSFTGMADSDNYTRTDYVYDKITPATRYKFDNWINKYKTGYTPIRPGVSANSDYWASGLKQAMEAYSLIPEIVIMITDGSQTANVPALKQQMANIANNEDSHLYIFGIGNGYYVNDTALPPDPNAYTNTNISDVTPRLMSSIKYLMEMAPTEFPVSGKDNLLSADYFETKDFSEFGDELTDPNGRFFSDRLANANIGCGGEAIPLDFCYDCETFQPTPGQTYWLSAWATEEQNIQVKTFTNSIIKMTFLNQAKIKVGEISFLPEGDIIDGWQRFASKFEIPATATMLNIELENLSPSIPVYFDDIRIHPLQGSMKSFVYDPETFRLMAEQDDNNYSTFYEYDNEGGLVRIKKETAKGIKTIQETRSGSVIQATGN